jgi:hypothetical protein
MKPIDKYKYRGKLKMVGSLTSYPRSLSSFLVQFSRSSALLDLIEASSLLTLGRIYEL